MQDKLAKKSQQLVHTKVEKSGKRSKWKFFLNWMTLERKRMTLTKSTVSKADR